MVIANLNDKVREGKQGGKRGEDGLFDPILPHYLQHERHVHQLEHDFSLQTAQQNEVSSYCLQLAVTLSQFTIIVAKFLQSMSS